MIRTDKPRKEVNYTEPADFFPESVRKEFGLGEFYDSEKDANPDSVKKV